MRIFKKIEVNKTTTKLSKITFRLAFDIKYEQTIIQQIVNTILAKYCCLHRQ